MEMKTEYLGIAGQLLTTLGTQIPLLGVWVAGAVLAAAGEPFDAIEREEPTLEDVFVSVIGEQAA